MIKELPRILKEAVTIHLYIQKLHNKGDYYNKAYVRLIRKITQKFINHLKDSEYDYKVNNIKMSEHLQYEVDKEKDNFLPTYIQIYCHMIIHEFCQAYDPAIKKEYRKAIIFYKQTLESLIN